MRRFFLLFFFTLLHFSAFSQNRYCLSWQDFLDGQWQETEGRVELSSASREDALAMEVKTDNKKMNYLLRKKACVLESQDSLYLNLRPFNTFGDVYVRAWRIGDKLLFARQDVAPSRFSIANGDNGIPVSKKMFGSLSPAIVQQLLTNHPRQLADYQAIDKKNRETADTVIGILQKAGVIR